MLCSSDSTSQNLVPTWLPHWPVCKCTISRMLCWTRRNGRWQVEQCDWDFLHTHATTSVPTLCAFRASPANTHLHRVDRRALIATHAFVTWITARPYELGRTQRSIGRSSLVCSARHRTRPHLGTWHYVWIGCTHSARCLYGCLQRVPQVESGCESARRG